MIVVGSCVFEDWANQNPPEVILAPILRTPQRYLDGHLGSYLLRLGLTKIPRAMG